MKQLMVFVWIILVFMAYKLQMKFIALAWDTQEKIRSFALGPRFQVAPYYSTQFLRD